MNPVVSRYKTASVPLPVENVISYHRVSRARLCCQTTSAADGKVYSRCSLYTWSIFCRAFALCQRSSWGSYSSESVSAFQLEPPYFKSRAVFLERWRLGPNRNIHLTRSFHSPQTSTTIAATSSSIHANRTFFWFSSRAYINVTATFAGYAS